MFIDLTPEQHALRLRGARLLPEPDDARAARCACAAPKRRAEYRDTIRKMGKRRLAGRGLAQGLRRPGLRRPTEQLIFFEEANIAGAPLPFVTISTVGPALMEHGTDAQKDSASCPASPPARSIFAIGYSEPEAGSDLASLKTTARLEGDHFVVNGNKLWTSGAEAADYVWLAARTDPDLPRHKGISHPDPGHQAARLLAHADPHGGQPHRRHLLRQRARCRPTCWSASCTAAGS
jgi:alkylation response protein AidB-like acyl-CoA dehydrogenase